MPGKFSMLAAHDSTEGSGQDSTSGSYLITLSPALLFTLPSPPLTLINTSFALSTCICHGKFAEEIKILYECKLGHQEDDVLWVLWMMWFVHEMAPERKPNL